MESPLGEGQLESYQRQIQTEYGGRGRLVLLARSSHSVRETKLDRDLFHSVCWHEVYSWLSNLELSDPLTSLYVDEFRGYLEGRAMGVQQVSWEYENGIKSMLILSNLLETAVSEAWPGADVKRTAGWNWRGLCFDGEYFIGCRFERFKMLAFESSQGTNPSFRLDLDFDDVHSHSLTAGEQRETITNLIRAARTVAETELDSEAG